MREGTWCLFSVLLALILVNAESASNDTNVTVSELQVQLTNVSDSVKNLSDSMKNLSDGMKSISDEQKSFDSRLSALMKDWADLKKLIEDDRKRNPSNGALTAPTRAPGKPSLPRDCWDLYQSGIKSNGLYRIYPNKRPGFEVYCDMTTDGGGWTVINRRGQFGNAQDMFYKPWKDYRNGFGDMTKEFWLGNEKLHTLTGTGQYQLRVDLRDTDNNTAYAKYQTFAVSDEDHNYELSVGDFTGNAGDAMKFQNGMMFTTWDRDNDKDPSRNCAVRHQGAWWFNYCQNSDLNGLNKNGQFKGFRNAVMWNQWKGTDYSLPFAEMKIKPKSAL